MRIRLLALLSNVDDAVVGLDLGLGLSIEKWPLAELLGVLQELDDLPEHETISRVADQYYATDDQDEYAYVITGEFTVEQREFHYPEGGLPLDSSWWGRQERITRHIGERLQVMRLFAEGNVDVPAIYFYEENNGTIEFHASQTRVAQVRYNPFQVSRNDVPRLQAFLNHWQLPFAQDYIQLAFDNYDESYSAHSDKTAFLLLMIALEVLFNQGAHELRYRISRGVAVLIGQTESEAKELFGEVRGLYDTRSQLVHTGTAKDFGSGRVLRLRAIVRHCVKCAAQLGISKDDLSDLLTRSGFGSDLLAFGRRIRGAADGADGA